jgi:membrane associated rhomboid family serine protease
MNRPEDSYRKRMVLGQDGNALVQLLVVNAVLFVALKFIYVIYLVVPLRMDSYYQNIFDWTILPADLHKFLTRPWTLFSYMFADRLVLRFIANMFWLWSFGYILQDLTGNRKLVPIYLYGGIVGGICYILAYHLFPQLHSAMPHATLFGANPAVVAVAVATTAVAPDYRIFPMINGGIPLWILTVVFALVNFSSISYGNSGDYVANLASAAMGLLFIYQMRKGRDWSVWMNAMFEWINNLFNPLRKARIKSAKDEFFYNVSRKQPFKKIPNITQKRIDDILDKINQQGYRFLTDEEKDILKRAAEKEDL